MSKSLAIQNGVFDGGLRPTEPGGGDGNQLTNTPLRPLHRCPVAFLTGTPRRDRPASRHPVASAPGCPALPIPLTLARSPAQAWPQARSTAPRYPEHEHPCAEKLSRGYCLRIRTPFIELLGFSPVGAGVGIRGEALGGPARPCPPSSLSGPGPARRQASGSRGSGRAGRAGLRWGGPASSVRVPLPRFLVRVGSPGDGCPRPGHPPVTGGTPSTLSVPPKQGHTSLSFPREGCTPGLGGGGGLDHVWGPASCG